MLEILVADDDLDDYHNISEAFAEIEQSHRLVHVADGYTLVSHLNQCIETGERLPDIILLDINMPKMNGLQALAIIRANRRFERIPIVVYTTCSDKELMRQCYLNGANGYAAKGFTFTAILNFVREISSFVSRNPNVSAGQNYDPSEQISHR